MNTLRKISRGLECWLVNVYEFWSNYWYYLDKGYPPNKAWELARQTL